MYHKHLLELIHVSHFGRRLLNVPILTASSQASLQYFSYSCFVQIICQCTLTTSVFPSTFGCIRRVREGNCSVLLNQDLSMPLLTRSDMGQQVTCGEYFIVSNITLPLRVGFFAYLIVPRFKKSKINLFIRRSQIWGR
jgi:hypothetical protein